MLGSEFGGDASRHRAWLRVACVIIAHSVIMIAGLLLFTHTMA